LGASDWYLELRADVVPLLSTVDGCRRAMREAALDGDIHPVRVEFPELGPGDLIAWRLGMAQHALFFAALAPERRARVVADAAERLGVAPPQLVRSVLVISIVRS
jgi:hypothetical protein